MKSVKNNQVSVDSLSQIEVLEQENRILKKKLMRSELTRSELETASQRRELMLKQVILDAEKAKGELQRSREIADSANKAKSEFLANMSHELKTPLNGILGYAQILGREESLTERGEMGLNIIAQSGDHLLTLINDILDLSKVEAGKMKLLYDSFNLLAFLQDVVEICRVRADQKGILFNFFPEENLPMGVTADAKRLRQVLLNLIDNAIKFTDHGQVFFVVRLMARNDKCRLRFEVQDTGVGIDPSQIQKICLPFEQVGDFRRQEGGTGLGLAISNQIIQMMESELKIDSRIGAGSVFSFEVDFLEAPEVASWVMPPRIGVRPCSSNAVPTDGTGRPPGDTLQQLGDFVRKGDLDSVRRVAERLGEQYQPFAQSVMMMTDACQVKRLKTFLAAK